MEKELLRKRYLQKRRELSPGEAELLSEHIADNFKKVVSLEGARCFHTFYPIPRKSEVNTILICTHIRQHHPGIRIVLSKSNLKHNTLSHYVWDDNTRLTSNKWGIIEPEGGTEVAVKDLDVILIPLLAFDMEGNRIGYGKGFYDRFLKQCRQDSLKIGLSFFEPVSTTIAAEQHDVRLDTCITPDSIYTF